jgi:hypothetical protein
MEEELEELYVEGVAAPSHASTSREGVAKRRGLVGTRVSSKRALLPMSAHRIIVSDRGTEPGDRGVRGQEADARASRGWT